MCQQPARRDMKAKHKPYISLRCPDDDMAQMQHGDSFGLHKAHSPSLCSTFFFFSLWQKDEWQADHTSLIRYSRWCRSVCSLLCFLYNKSLRFDSVDMVLLVYGQTDLVRSPEFTWSGQNKDLLSHSSAEAVKMAVSSCFRVNLHSMNNNYQKKCK